MCENIIRSQRSYTGAREPLLHSLWKIKFNKHHTPCTVLCSGVSKVSARNVVLAVMEHQIQWGRDSNCIINTLTTKWQGFPPSSVGKESACNAGDPGSISGSGRCPGEGVGYPLQYSWASLVVQLVKNLPTMWEIWVWSLGWEDPLEKRIATPVFWPGEFHGLYSSWGRKESDRLSNFHFHKSAKPNKYRVLKA